MKVWFFSALVIRSSEHADLQRDWATVDAFVPAESVRIAKSRATSEILARGYRVLSIELLYEWFKYHSTPLATDLPMLPAAKDMLAKADHAMENRAAEAARTGEVLIGGFGPLLKRNFRSEPQITPGCLDLHFLAYEQAVRRRHELVEPEHVLLALLGRDVGIATLLIQRLGINAKKLASEVAGMIPMRGDNEQRSCPPGMSDSSDRVFTTARRVALGLGCGWWGTEHVLLALIKLREFAPGRLFHRLGVTYDRVAHMLAEVIAGEEYLQ